MKRVPEPELMDDPEQAHAYALADFSEPHQAFVQHFGERFPGYPPRRTLDLGCGAADISVRFARAYPDCQILGIDGADAMLALGRKALTRAGLGDRVQLLKLHLPAPIPDAHSFDTIISNSLLHHLQDPRTLWRALVQAGRRAAAIFVMDLMRPGSKQAARELVMNHAGAEPEVLRRDFYNSLLAAYRPEEVRAQLELAGLSGTLAVEGASDRHLVVWGYLS